MSSDKKFYVYGLFDPVSDEIFYVGKGQGDRPLSHIVEAKKHLDGSYKPAHRVNMLKVNKIIKILKSGKEVTIKILHSDLTETEAFALERCLILEYGRRDNNTGVLTNMTDGGEGVSGRLVSESQRKQISETTKRLNEAGVLNAPSSIEKANSKRIGQKRTQEFKDGQRKRATGNTNNRGKIIVNNGVNMKYVYENEIPEGYVRGKLDKHKAYGNKACLGLIWINNGIINKKIKPEDMHMYPDFVKGRVSKKS